METEPRAVGLILSGRYVDQNLAREFGKIPPAFLPIGEMRLIELQVKELGKYAEFIYLTLPSNYKISEFDQILLEEMNVKILQTEPNLSIAKGISTAIRQIGSSRIHPLILLYGDTLCTIPMQANSIAGSMTPAFYEWGEFNSQIEIDKAKDDNTIALVGASRIQFVPQFLEILESGEEGILPLLEEYINLTKAKIEIVETWFDFGHVATYFESRKSLQQSRHFNSIKIIDDHVYKQSNDSVKIEAEYQWYKNVPEEMSIYFPRVTGKQESGYSTEYLRAPTLQELIVFTDHDLKIWKIIFKSISNYFLVSTKAVHAKNFKNEHDDFSRLIKDKTLKRFSQIEWDQIGKFLGTDQQKLFMDSKRILDFCLDSLSEWDGMSNGVLHGDMCATNIFWDSHNLKIKLIDPRGIDSEGNLMSSGNIAYDIAKLYQSFVFNYEYIICSRYKLDYTDQANPGIRVYKTKNQRQISELFVEFMKGIPKFQEEKIRQLATLLLFSLIPLHNDRPDRQAAFLILALGQSEEEIGSR